MVYLVLQEEVGDNGTPHLQGYVEFSIGKRMSAVKTLFACETMHLERRRGRQEQAIAYCKKAESRLQGGLAGEFGIPRGPRGRPKGAFSKSVVMLRDGSSISAVREAFPEASVMYRDKLLDEALRLTGGRDWAMSIEIYVGPSGSGKSTTAKLENVDAYACPWPAGGRWWWPGYEGQDCVILDEFRHQVKMDVLLKLFDRHCMWLEAKGRNFQFSSHKVVITTNLDPADWYPGVPVGVKEPLARRIREFAVIYDFDSGGVYPHFVKVARDMSQFVFAATRDRSSSNGFSVYGS